MWCPGHVTRSRWRDTWPGWAGPRAPLFPPHVSRDVNYFDKRSAHPAHTNTLDTLALVTSVLQLWHWCYIVIYNIWMEKAPTNQLAYSTRQKCLVVDNMQFLERASSVKIGELYLTHSTLWMGRSVVFRLMCSPNISSHLQPQSSIHTVVHCGR